MGTVSVSLPADGTTADVADYNTPITTIVNELNGNLDNANIKAAAAIDGSKLADDGITAAKMQYGMIRSRQGGSSTVWSTTGTTTYDTSATAVFVQAGSRSISGTTGTDVTITFPTAFTYAPIVLVSTATADGANVTFASNTPTTTTVKVRIIFTGGGSQTETVSWMAIGQ